MILGFPNILAFTEKRFRVPDGQHKGEPLLIKDVPWFERPLQKIEDDRVKIVTVYKATGGGGTTIGEIGAAHRFVKRPANMLWNTHIDNKVDEAATRLLSDQFDEMPEITARYRESRYDKDLIALRRCAYPPCRFVVQAANQSNAQSTRADTIFNDELWKWKPGIYEEMVQRTTGDWPFSKVVNLTSASEYPGQAADVAFREGDQDEYHLRCIHCGELVLPLFGRESRTRYGGLHVMVWDKEGSFNHQAGSVRMVCPHCDKEVKNTPRNRRRLLEGSEYVRANHENSIEVYSCRFNSLIPWFEPWEKTVLKWLKANEQAKFGALEALRDVYIKCFAITYDGRADANEEELYVSQCYDLVPVPSPIEDGDMWIAPEDEFTENETNRYLLVDYQRSGDLWVWAVQVDEIGTNRLMWAGKLTEINFEKIEALRQFFEIDRGRVGIDAGTDANVADLYKNCAIYGFTALNAENRTFLIPTEIEDPESGEIVEEMIRYPFSPAKLVGKYYRSEEDDEPVHCRLILWDKNWISEMFDRIRVGKAFTKLLLPGNMYRLDGEWRKSEKIPKQLTSMVFADPKALRGRPVLEPKKIWTKRTQNAQEHLWDCASMAMVLQSIDGYFEEAITIKNDDRD